MADPKFDSFSHKTPPSFDTTATNIKFDAQALIETTSSLCRRIVDSVTSETATFDNTVRPFAEDENSKSEKENHLRFYASTHPDKELREASYAVTDLFNIAEADLFSRTDYFALVDSVMSKVQSSKPLSLDDELMYYLIKFHQRFVMNGCGITDEQTRETFVSKKKRISELAKQSRKNMANEKTGLWLTRNELRGMDESFVGKLTEGVDEHAGYFWVPTKTPYSVPIFNHATDEATRKKVYYAVWNRMPDNVPMHRELVLLRDETARLAAWPNHFAFKTSQKMMKTPEAVHKLLAEVRAALTPVAEKTAEQLLELKVAEATSGEESVENVKLFHWDRAYFETKLDEQAGNAESLTSEYFELNTTLGKLLDIYIQIFGVKFVPVEGTSREVLDQGLVWHEDVQMFSVWDVDEAEPGFLGYAYLDLFPRDGKYTHAGQYALQRRYRRSDGTYFDPCACLVMNYMKPSPERPTLLNFNDVRSLFHELGHMYHGLLSRSQYARLHAVDSDFIETPSMMLEQFFWDPKIIHGVSHHYSYISPEMRQAWLTSRGYGSGDTAPEIPLKISLEDATKLGAHEATRRVRRSLNELFFSTYDMLIHSPASHEDLKKTNLPELYNRLRCEIFKSHGGEALGDGWEYCQGQSVFRAIQGKYDAGYYAYLLGRLFAINIFEAGFAGDVLNKENGRRYRDMVLCKGGTQPEMKTLTEYLGHEPSSKPYLAWLGVKEA
ncbi:hypothetical protein PRZ48_008587 [Zasmidium cellare]|uniref:Peptidase M3A/M3B catalytic domain-containing protein n=1 Tax=Zasmidium cellare TaxID=395010 RepID=A0ABR0EGZ9_ZASCE|nr:hypothetical protein PRZ48_008587 [Zasmidium cellare]